MGNWFAAVLDTLSGTKQKRILMLGLDAAGKTTVLYRLNLGETVHTIPTIGFNVERVRYKNIEFDMWDVGGQTKLRPLWRHYFNNTDALIFVVDSADLDRMGEAKNELHALLTDARLADSKLLVFANKQDLPGALPVDEVAKQFDLSTLRDREWFVQACCATNGEGVYEGLNWLSKVLCRR